jgi:general secretion pathway protein K
MVRTAVSRSIRGAAIILAMLIAALAAVVAVAVTTEQQRWFSDVANRRDQVQAQALALAGVQWARQIMQDDARTSTIDHLGEPWAFPLPRTPLENGSIEGNIADAQGRLNINNLAANDALGKEERARLARLVAQRGVSPHVMDAINASVLAAPATTDTLTSSEPPAPVPLPTSLRPVRVAELAGVAGAGDRDITALRPYITALPAATVLNVNTAPAEVLSVALQGLSPDSLAELVAERSRKPFATLSDFRARLPGGVMIPNETTLGVASSYFLVSVRARQGDAMAEARALLRRDGREWPIVVWQLLE